MNLADHRLAACRATTAWELHRVSISYYLHLIFDDANVGDALVFRATESSEVLARARTYGKVLRITGRDRFGCPDHLWALYPWDRDLVSPAVLGIVSPLIYLELKRPLRESDVAAGLELLAFEVYHHFLFVADSSMDLQGTDHTMARLAFKRMGWTEIRGVREGSGSLGHKPEDEG